MGLIKEPLNVDFYVDPRPMTDEDKKAISDYIKAEKAKLLKKSGNKASTPNRITSRKTKKSNLTIK